MCLSCLSYLLERKKMPRAIKSNAEPKHLTYLLSPICWFLPKIISWQALRSGKLDVLIRRLQLELNETFVSYGIWDVA